MNSLIIAEMQRVFQDAPYGIAHTNRVLANAQEIMAGEGTAEPTRQIISLAAILHDIGALEAQKKYGSMDGHGQEIEGPAMARAILERAGVSSAEIDRVCYIVGNHHTISKIDGVDFQILWEADLLDTLEFGKRLDDCDQLRAMIEENFRTATGTSLAFKRCGVE